MTISSPSESVDKEINDPSHRLKVPIPRHKKMSVFTKIATLDSM
jgi:hypothetical protein